jgi:hypothetical protein
MDHPTGTAPVRLFGRRVMLRPLIASDFAAFGEVRTRNGRWLTDWEPSQTFPVYTRANAGEVLPDPASPLAWTLVWEPGVVEGWADANVSAGTLNRDEIEKSPPEVVGLFGGYLYINGSMARLFGVRGRRTEDTEVVIFLTPRIAQPMSVERAGAADAADAADAELERRLLDRAREIVATDSGAEVRP